jgi:hypothetical protein
MTYCEGSPSPNPIRQPLAPAMCMAELHIIYFTIQHKIQENIKGLKGQSRKGTEIVDMSRIKQAESLI